MLLLVSLSLLVDVLVGVTVVAVMAVVGVTVAVN